MNTILLHSNEHNSICIFLSPVAKCNPDNVNPYLMASTTVYLSLLLLHSAKKNLHAHIFLCLQST